MKKRLPLLISPIVIAWALVLVSCHSGNDKSDKATSTKQAQSQAKKTHLLPPPIKYSNSYGNATEGLPDSGEGYAKIAPTPFNKTLSKDQLKQVKKHPLIPETIEKRKPNKDIPGTPQNAIQNTLIHQDK